MAHRSPTPNQKSGFAVVIAISLMAFVLVLLLTLSALVRIEAQSAALALEQLKARQNALLGAMVAVGRIQELTGPDQVSTFHAAADQALDQTDVDNPTRRTGKWVGVRDTALLNADESATNDDREQLLGWLVSGAIPAIPPVDPANPDAGEDTMDPRTGIDPQNVTAWDGADIPAQDNSATPQEEGYATLVGRGSAIEDAINFNPDFVAAPKVVIDDGAGKFAWWASDENSKARINLADEFFLDGDPNTDDRRQVALQRSGSEMIFDTTPFNPTLLTNQQRLARALTAAHMDILNNSAPNAELARRHFHDITAHSLSLLTNPRYGGFKKDITSVLVEAEAQTTSTAADEYLLPPEAELGDGSLDLSTEIGKLFAHSDKNLERLLTRGLIVDFTEEGFRHMGVDTNGRDLTHKPDYRDRVFPPMGFLDPENDPGTSDASDLADEYLLDPDESQSSGSDVGGRLAQDAGGPFWRQLLSWATTRQRVEDELSSSLQYLYTTSEHLGVYPVILRYTMMRFHTVQGNTIRLHFSPVVTLWNPTDVEIPNQDYFINFFMSSETSGSNEAARETLNLNVTDSTGDIDTEWVVRIVSARADQGLNSTVGAPFVAEWNGSLEPGEAVTLAMESGVRTQIPNRGTDLFQGNARRIQTPQDNGSDPPMMTLLLEEWSDPSQLNSQSLGSAYVDVELSDLATIASPNFEPTATLNDLSLTFETYGRPNSLALQLSPRWRYDDGGRRDLSYGEGDGSAIVDQAYYNAPIFTIFQPPLRVPESVKSTMVINFATLPGHSASIHAGEVSFAQTIGLRVPDEIDDPYDAARATDEDTNLYAPYAQLAWGNPISREVGRAPPQRSILLNAERQGYGSPPQYIGGWTDSAEDFVGSEPFFGFDPFQAGASSPRAILRDFPESIHDVTSIASLQNAMPFTQESVQFRGRFGLKTGINQLSHLSGMRCHGWGGNNVPLNSIGNSLASPFVPSNQYQFTQWEDPGVNMGYKNYHTFYDYSYVMNEALWDDYFFSSNANSRLRWTDPTWNTDETLIDRDVDESGANLTLQGGFNVNSTSVSAWAVLLGGMLGSPVQVGGTPEEDPLEAPFSRFKNPQESAINAGSIDADDPEVYSLTFRALSPEEIWDNNGTPNDESDDTGLAVEIVNQVRERGPFNSLAEFVNRALVADDTGSSDDPYDLGHHLKGALQAAIDQTTINESVIDGEVISEADFEIGDGRSDDWLGLQREHVDGVPLNWGAPGFLTQADVLSRIGSSLTSRSDTFTIRAYGESGTSPDIIAVCEVVVRRSHDYVDPTADPATDEVAELDSDINRTFGRKYEIVGFRWIASNEI